MTNLFIPYSLALLAKEKGFKEPCFGLFNQIKELCYAQLNLLEYVSFIGQDRIIPAPTHQQIVDWFRSKHNIFINYANHFTTSGQVAGHLFDIYNQSKLLGRKENVGTFESEDYYTAFNEAIEQAFKTIS